MRISKSTRTSVKASKKSDDTHAVAARADFYRRELVKCGYTKEEVKNMGIKELRDAYNNCDVDACGDIKASVDSDIAKYKKSLESKAAKSGVYENFGAAEVRKLKDKYRTLPDDEVDYRTAEHNRSSIDSFEDWCMNYVGANTSTDKALKHIKAAIDILGTSGDKSDVTKDSIANLGVVMFDLQSKK